MDITEEKLKIATDALRHYEKKSIWDMCRTGGFQHRHYGFVTDDQMMPEGWEVAEKALAEMRHLDLSDIVEAHDEALLQRRAKGD